MLPIDSILAKDGGRTEVVYGMSFADYRAAPGLNASSLKSASTSMLQFEHDWHHPRKDTPAMKLGRAIHCALLTPRLLDEQYRVWDLGDKRQCPKVWKAFKEECAAVGAEILDEDGPISVSALKAAAERWLQHKPTMNALAGSRPEVSVFWCEDNIQWKARLDLLREDLIGDVKTARDIQPHPFRRDAEKFQYPLQLGIYRRGVSQVLKTLLPVQLLCIENHSPYDCRVYEMPEDDLDWGWVQATKLAQQVHECVVTGVWPGQGADEVEALPPPAAYLRDDYEDEFQQGEYQ